MTRITVQGERKLRRELKKLERKFKDEKQKRKIGVKSSKPVSKEARKEVPKDEGLIRKSIGVLRASKRFPGVYVGPKRNVYKRERPSNLPVMLEYGSKRHKPSGFMRKGAMKLRESLQIAIREYRKLLNKK